VSSVDLPVGMTFVRANLPALVIFGVAILGGISGPAAAQDDLFERERATGD
jgi:hypothetical protein